MKILLIILLFSGCKHSHHSTDCQILIMQHMLQDIHTLLAPDTSDRAKQTLAEMDKINNGIELRKFGCEKYTK